MNRLGKLIYENDFEYKVYAVSLKDNATTRISFELYIMSPEGEMSDLITIQKKDIYAKKNWANVFWGLEAGFDRKDIDSIKWNMMKFIKKEPHTCFQSREPLDSLYQIISSYIREKCLHRKGDNTVTHTFMKGDYGYMDSYMLEEFVKEYKDVGYKRLEIIKRLKIMGALEGTNGRNDVLVSIKGKKKRFYKILLAKEEKETEECEVYETPVKKTEEAESK